MNDPMEEKTRSTPIPPLWGAGMVYIGTPLLHRVVLVNLGKVKTNDN